MPELGDVQVEEIEITNDVYSTRCTFNEILENEQGKAVLNKYLGDFSQKPMFEMMKGMKITTLATMAEDVFNEKMLYTLNKELIKIKKSK